MLTRSALRIAVGLAAIGTFYVGRATAQPGGPGGDDGGPGARPGPGPGRFAWDANLMRAWSDPNYMRRMMSDRMRQAVGATEEEWTVLEPKVEKVQRLSADARGGGMMGGMGFFMGMGRRGGEESEVMKASQALRKVLEDKDASPGDIKAALQTLRDARAKAKAALEEAQKELRALLTLRQEANLVQMGLLD